MVAALRVLVVDDYRDCADAISLLLNFLNFDVRVAYDGATAIEIAQGFRPDIILLDLGMPETDGFQVAKHIRRTSPSSTLLVAYTGYPSFRHEAKEAGFDDYLLKPVGIDRLKEVLERASETRNQVAQGKTTKVVQDKGFGFMESSDDRDVVLYVSGIADEGFDYLEGQWVEAARFENSVRSTTSGG